MAHTSHFKQMFSEYSNSVYQIGSNLMKICWTVWVLYVEFLISFWKVLESTMKTYAIM